MSLKETISSTKLYSIFHKTNINMQHFIELIEVEKYTKSSYSRSIATCRDTTHKRLCFIIGNGPSLSVEDLDLLKENEVDCFASNRIYNLYNKTEWRPTYYVCQDDKVMKQIYSDLPYAINESELSFISLNNFNHTCDMLTQPKTRFFYIRNKYRRDNEVRFANDISTGVYEGMSVTYTMAQIAVYIGYREIYLLGVDHTYTPRNTNTTDRNNHFEGIREIDIGKLYPTNYIAMNRAYEKFRDYAQDHKIIVRNATRGGMLEIYNRVNFDDLFSK